MCQNTLLRDKEERARRGCNHEVRAGVAQPRADPKQLQPAIDCCLLDVADETFVMNRERTKEGYG